MKPPELPSLEIVELQECTSTNDEAWLRFQSGNWIGNPVVFSAKAQTKGRGRQGRLWESDISENLYASLLIAPPSQALSWLPLAAGVATMRAITRVLAEMKVTADLNYLRLKWPNDIMWGQKKAGGILCESRFSGNQCLGVVVGLGLNIASAPQLNSELEATSLKEQLEVQSAMFQIDQFHARFIKHWSLDLLHWSTLLDLGSTSELQDAWNQWAKLKIFPQLKTHNADGMIINLTAIELDASGRLKAQVYADQGAVNGETIYLDQALNP